jgi:hypothetical protein
VSSVERSAESNNHPGPTREKRRSITHAKLNE